MLEAIKLSEQGNSHTIEQRLVMERKFQSHIAKDPTVLFLAHTRYFAYQMWKH